MVAAKRKSKKQSVARLPQQQLRQSTTFFVDRNLSPTVAPPLRESGYLVEVHDDHFETDCKDVDWIPEVAGRGWVCLTRDNQISINPLERRAVIEHRLKLFIVKGGGLSGHVCQQVLLDAMPKILNAAHAREAPLIGRVSRSLRISYVDLQ